MATKLRTDAGPRKRFAMTLPKTVIGLGLVSLFTDVSSEAIFPLLPAFLTTLGASNAFIGLVEGAASTSFGLLWDRFGSVTAFGGSGTFALIAAVTLILRIPAHAGESQKT
jgi:hypothetical protein